MPNNSNVLLHSWFSANRITWITMS